MELRPELPGPCWGSHSRCPLIKLHPCSLLSCWQTKVLKRTPGVIASNLGHNVLFHVSFGQRKEACCSGPVRPLSPWTTPFNFQLRCFFIYLFRGRKKILNCNSGKHFSWHRFAWRLLIWFFTGGFFPLRDFLWFHNRENKPFYKLCLNFVQ